MERLFYWLAPTLTQDMGMGYTKPVTEHASSIPGAEQALTRLIDAVLVINLDGSSERWDRLTASFANHGLADKIHRIPAIRGTDVKGWNQKPWFTERSQPRIKQLAGAGGCALSHTRAVEYALAHPEWKHVLILEDDVEPDWERIAEYGQLLVDFLESGEQWDLIYLGHTESSKYVGLSPLSRQGEFIIARTSGVIGAYGMLVNRSGLEAMAKSFPHENNIWGWLAQYKANDYWLKKWYAPFANVYIIHPFFILHDAGVSDISGNLVDIKGHDHFAKSIFMKDGELAGKLAGGSFTGRINLQLDRLFRWMSCRTRGFSPGKRKKPPTA